MSETKRKRGEEIWCLYGRQGRKRTDKSFMSLKIPFKLDALGSIVTKKKTQKFRKPWGVDREGPYAYS